MFEAFLLHRLLFRVPAMKLLIAITELLSAVHPRTYEAVMWRQPPRDFITQINASKRSVRPAPQLEKPETRPFGSWSWQTWMSRAVPFRPPKRSCRRVKTRPQAPRPRGFMRTITSFQNPAGRLAGTGNADINQGLYANGPVWEP